VVSLLQTLFTTGNMKLIIEKLSEGSYEVTNINKIHLGEFYREIDGFFVFIPGSEYGFYSEQYLQALLFELQQLNAPWKENIRKHFENESNKQQD
jgi:hypothetical protein